jgi:hypothetical protein
MLKVSVKYNVNLTNYPHLPLYGERYSAVCVNSNFTTSEIERIIAEKDKALQRGTLSIVSVEIAEKKQDQQCPNEIMVPKELLGRFKIEGNRFLECVREIHKETSKWESPEKAARATAFAMCLLLDGSGEWYPPSLYRVCIETSKGWQPVEFFHHDL